MTLTASFVVPTDQLSGSDAPLLEVVEVGPLGISTKLFAFTIREAMIMLISALLISTGDLSTLADTTVLLLFVFTIVNIAVLVQRRERVEHEHFTVPSVFPVLGAVVSVALILDTALDDPSTFARAGGLVALGAVLWLVNRLVEGPHDEVEADRLRG